MSLNFVANPYSYYSNRNKTGPLYNGEIYVGNPDTDPTIPANQKQVTAKQEDGTQVPIAQPVSTNSGGYAVDSAGNPVVLLVDGNYSIRVNDRLGRLALEQSNVNEGVPLTANDIGRGLDKIPLNSYLRVSTIEKLRLSEPEVNLENIFLNGHTLEGIGGGNFYYDESDTTSPDDNGTIIVTNGGKRWKREENGYVTPEMFGCIDGSSLPESMDAIQESFKDNGVNIKFTLPIYNGVSSDIRLNYSHINIEGSGRRTKIVFNQGASFRLGTAILSDPNKTGDGSNKIVNTTISNLQFSCVTDYDGDLLVLEYADSTTLRNVISGPVNTTPESASLATGIKLIWVQWVYGYSCQFGGNKAALYIEMTNHGQDNEDHFHFYGTTFYTQKNLRAGVSNASIYVWFANGRSNGASEVSFDGCHIGQFAVSGSDLSNNYGLVADLDGNSGDKTPMQNWMFNSTMFEACGTMIDLETLNAGNGAVIGNNSYNNCYFVGNAFTTQKMVVARAFKASMIITSCAITSIDQLFEDILVRWVGSSNVINNNTFTSNGSITNHSFDGWRPCSAIRSSRVLNQTLNSSETEIVVNHGLGGKPKIINVNKGFMANHTITNINDTDFTFTVDVAPSSNQTITFDMHVQSST